jgi:hypothetical protein
VNLTARPYAGQEVFDILAPIRRRFALNNGWTGPGRSFPIEKIATILPPTDLYPGPGRGRDETLLDHPEYYRCGRRPICIVAHSYSHKSLGRAIALAQRFGLWMVSSTTHCWWNPGTTRLLILTPPGVRVVLPTIPEIAEIGRVYEAWDIELDQRQREREREQRDSLRGSLSN